MQVLLDLWIFRILASLLGIFHLIIQQIKTARSPCLRLKSKEVHKYGHGIHSAVLFNHNSKMHVASLKPQPTLTLELAAIWGEIISDRVPYSGASARVALKELHRSSQVKAKSKVDGVVRFKPRIYQTATPPAGIITK